MNQAIAAAATGLFGQPTNTPDVDNVMSAAPFWRDLNGRPQLCVWGMDEAAVRANLATAANRLHVQLQRSDRVGRQQIKPLRSEGYWKAYVDIPVEVAQA